MVILGISIGTRTSGIAIITKRGLVTWGTLTFKHSWSEQKSNAIIRKYEKYIKRHKVTLVVLKIPPLSHHTDAITELLNRLQDMIGFHGCLVEYKTQEQIKRVLPHVRNKKQIMEHTATLYPILTHEHDRELKSKNSYYDKLFEAVLVAHLYREEHRDPPDRLIT
jgi:RNase H-fold protein (predicted Holliday junction resolvase)